MQVVSALSIPDILAPGIHLSLASTRRISGADTRNDEVLLMSHIHCVVYGLPVAYCFLKALPSNTTLTSCPLDDVKLQNDAEGCSESN